MEKTCSKCKKTINISNFYYFKKRNYREAWCKNCRYEYNKKRLDIGVKILGSKMWANRQLCKMRSRAKHKNMEFKLSKKELILLRNKPCTYCHRKLPMNETSIDRKDNSIGYLESNCVPSCRMCNTIKGEHLTYEEMILVGKIISKRYIKK